MIMMVIMMKRRKYFYDVHTERKYLSLPDVSETETVYSTNGELKKEMILYINYCIGMHRKTKVTFL